MDGAIPSGRARLFSLCQGPVYNRKGDKIRDFRPLEIGVKTKKNPKNVQKKAKNTQKNPKTAIIAVGWLFEKICALTFNALDAGTFTS